MNLRLISGEFFGTIPESLAGGISEEILIRFSKGVQGEFFSTNP